MAFVVAVIIANVVFVIVVRRVLRAPATGWGRLSKRDTRLLAVAMLAIALAVTADFVGDSDTSTIPLLIFAYGVAGWLAIRALDAP